jgi:hypothetical protein
VSLCSPKCEASGTNVTIAGTTGLYSQAGSGYPALTPKRVSLILAPLSAIERFEQAQSGDAAVLNFAGPDSSSGVL